MSSDRDMTNKSYFFFPKLAHNLWTDRKIDDPHPTTSKKYLYHTRAMDRGRSFIHLRSLEARTIQDRLLSEEVEWNGSDYPLASALTLLTSPTLCLLRFLIHVLLSISICMILILQSIYPLVLPIELLSMFFPFREMVTVPNAELAAVPNGQCLWGFPSLQLSPVSPMCCGMKNSVHARLDALA